MHNVPIVAYSKVGLDLISAKVGRLMRLDAHTQFICLNSWGRSDYARALVEVSADKPLIDSVDIDIPREDGKGHITVTVRIEFEWHPPRCGTCKIFDHLESMCPMKRVADPSKKCDMQDNVKRDKRLMHTTYIKGNGKQVSSQLYIKGYRVNIPKSKLVYRARENQGEKVSSKKSSSSMEILNEDSDTDVEEVFLPNDRTTFPSSSGSSGHPLEEDAYEAYEESI
ncbi:zinc knuckle CX2CX4HX4C containing protein [Tanacetum coccineum]|uniref:Zinc knuckle CX2CX4HX4C containing protein n=1 Tax=Tanacetum coccineum TaxID=301880 RepID=A0ABQ4X1Y6_9ASTR